MSRSSARRDRGQTEPLAALVAVATIGLAVGLYGGYLTGVLGETTDRTPESVAIDRVWDDVSENGVFTAIDGNDGAIRNRVRIDSLPEGKTVHVAITTVDDGEKRVIDHARFHADGTVRDPARVGDPPADTGVATRPVPVELEPGDVRGGTLRVEVWSQ
ncbi:hypothetical protein SAMN05444422_11326 [Halobiforma haloterrestris]|uniref:Uncharacterized protein n=1 Tax=Natronobacterium haloterrestre TaxID=148448 RepID=A0A1I1KW58_NATHA|nr:hypothetical protein [Halobiforma haloterrestris]SFC64845.1 hypothetical protein SAMN05444422_11326 [Halobiforma haloterrestris]